MQEFVYMTIPSEWYGRYHQILLLFSEVGATVSINPDENNKALNDTVLTLFSMLTAAISAKNLGDEKAAANCIVYIDNQLKYLDNRDVTTRSILAPPVKGRANLEVVPSSLNNTPSLVTKSNTLKFGGVVKTDIAIEADQAVRSVTSSAILFSEINTKFVCSIGNKYYEHFIIETGDTDVDYNGDKEGTIYFDKDSCQLYYFNYDCIMNIKTDYDNNSTVDTSNRPTNPNRGAYVFNITTGKPQWFDGSKWITVATVNV